MKHLIAAAMSAIMLLPAAVFAGNPPITPAWAFGHIVWEDEKNTTAGAESLVQGYLDRNIPVSGIIIDSPWTTSYNDFNWDRKRYADPAAMIRGFNDKNIRVILWMTGVVNDRSKDTPEQKSKTYDYVVEQKLGINDSKPGDWWKGHGVHIDFTSAKAKEWWYSQLDQVFTEGVYGFKVDQGEIYFGNMVKTSAGTMNNDRFRPYYYDAMYDYVQKRRGETGSEGIIIGRPYSHQGGYAASVEKLSLGWCGDFAGDWAGLKKQIENVYISAQRGYGSVGCEIAGFFGARANHNQFIRYAQFACMTAAMVNGGENGAFSNHLPWYHGEDVEKIYRSCVYLHMALAPYKFSTVAEAHLRGGSLIREVSFAEESHLLGTDIFTKAITGNNAHVTYHLPNHDSWIDFHTGKEYAAGAAVTQDVPLNEFPLFFKSGSIVPLHVTSKECGIGDETMADATTLLIFPNGKTERVLHLPDGNGTDYTDCHVSFDEKTGSLAIQSPKARKYVVLLKNSGKPADVKGVDGWSYDAAAATLTVRASGSDIAINLSGQ